MKKSNKLTAAVTASAVMAAMVVPAASAASASFSDIDSSFAKDAIVKLADLGILNGKGDNKFDPQGNVTRAEFAKILTLALKLDVTSAPASATFSDVATGDWSYKYVEAAVKAKLINGVGNGQFGPNQQLSRQDMAVLFVRALGTDVTGKGASLTFADKDGIASYAQDAVAYAVEIGLINGVGENKFNPQGNASREAIAKVANLFLDKVSAVNELKVDGKTNVGVGEKVQFKATGANAVVWTASGNGVIDQAGNFVANAAGEATVTATAANGKTASVKVHVYGVAQAVKIDVAKDLLANGKSNQVLTAYAVDANGNPVENFEGTATVAITTNGAAKIISQDSLTSTTTYAGIGASITSLTFKAGKAQFVEVAGLVPGLKDTITVSALTAANGLLVTGFTPSTTDVKTVAQIATSISVTASKPIIAANGNNDSSVITATVLDQDGKAMLTGTYGLKFNVSGVAKWTNTGDQTQQSLSYTGGVAAPFVTIGSVQGVTGATTVSVTADGLTAGSVTVNSAVAGNPAKLTLTDASGSSDFVQGSLGNTDLTVATTDANGTPSNYTIDNTKAIYASVVDANGNNAANIMINGTASSSTGLQLLNPNISLVTDAAAAPEAGSYKLIVKDQTATGALSTVELPFKVLANTQSAAKKLSFKVANNIVPASNPTTTVSTQVTDEFGNALAQADVPVTFQATTVGTTKAAFNGGSKLSTPNVTVKTDANGVATATFTADAYDGQTWSITPSTTATGFVGTAPQLVKVAYLVPTSMGVTLTGTSGSSYQVVAGQALGIKLAQKDAYGNEIVGGTQNPNVKVTVSSAAGINFPASTPLVKVDPVAGTITGTLLDVQNVLDTAGVTAHKAGTVTFTVENTSVAGVAAASGAINVLPDAQSNFALFDANGVQVSGLNNKVAVEANKEVVLYLKPVDGQGNVVAARAGYTVNLNADGGNFRTVSNGVFAPSVNFANGNSSMAVYYVNATAGSYVPAVTSVAGAANAVTGLAYDVPSAAATAARTVAVSNAPTVKDAQGMTIASTGTYSIPTTPGVTIDAATGLLTVAAATAAGTVDVTYTQGTAAQTVTVTF